MKINWERIELFLHGLFFRFSFLLFFVLFIGVFVYAYHTEQAQNDIGASAPFADRAAVIEESAGDIETDAVTKAHRTRREMEVWIVESVSELLNLDQDNIELILEAAEPYFTAGAFGQYKTYLESDNMLPGIRAGRIRLGAIVDQTPQMMNDGLIGGKYRWLYDVPVLLTVSPVQGAPRNTKATLRLQIGRVEDDANPDKMVIESWNMMQRR